MNLKSAAIGALALLTPGLAHAAPLTWTLQNAVFDDGGAATGSFVFDADTGVVGDYAFDVSGGDTDTYPALSYDPSNAYKAASYEAHASDPTPNYLFVFTVPGGPNLYRSLYLTLADAPTNAGGTISLDFNSGFAAGECFNCAPYRPFASGSVSAERVTGGVPEPATWALMLLGLGTAGGALRRRRALAAA